LRIEGFSINISEGGIYLFAAADISVGTQIDIEFRLPDSTQSVHNCGTVRRRAVYLYAIEFLTAVNASAPDAATTAEAHRGT
jgi:hypothetical protein